MSQLSKGILAGKHERGFCKDIITMHTPIMFSSGRRGNTQCSLLLLRHHELNTNLKYMKLNLGPQGENMVKKNVRWQETMFLKSKTLRRRGRNGVLSPSQRIGNGMLF